MLELVRWILLLGFLNWFYAVGFCVYSLIKGRKDKLFLIRSALTIFIPWLGGVLFWLFPLGEKLIQRFSNQ